MLPNWNQGVAYLIMYVPFVMVTIGATSRSWVYGLCCSGTEVPLGL